MEQEVMTLSVDTGSVLIEVKDRGEEVIGTFRFNPSDMDIIRRYEKVVSSLDEIKIPDEPEPEEMLKVTDEIKKQFDYLLNYNVSDGIFAKCNPFSITANGDFYFENVLEGIAGLIQNITNQRIDKKKEKIKEAIAQLEESEESE